MNFCTKERKCSLPLSYCLCLFPLTIDYIPAGLLLQLTYADMAAAECVRRLRDNTDLEFALLHSRRRLEDGDGEGEEFQDAHPCLWSLQDSPQYTPLHATRDFGGSRTLLCRRRKEFD